MRLAGRAPARNTCSRRFVPTRLAERDNRPHRSSFADLPQPKTSASYPFESGGEPILCCLGTATDAKDRPSLAGFLYVLPARLYNGFALPAVRERLC